MANIKFKNTKVIRETLRGFNEGKTLILHSGGSRSGKTYGILKTLIHLAINHELVINIGRESLPKNKDTVMKDFFNILKEIKIYSIKSHNKSEHTYRLKNSVFKFFSTEDIDKLQGFSGNICFLNECNNTEEGAYDQLRIRHKLMICDFNPRRTFYVHKYKDWDTTLFVESTYQDNDYLDQSIKDTLESYKETNSYMFKVFCLGMLGDDEDSVFTNYSILEEYEEINKAFYIGTGVDFGYRDELAVIDVYYDKALNILYLEEKLYEKGVLLTDYCSKVNGINLICDSARPDLIQHLKNCGKRTRPTVAKDIQHRITLMQSMKIFIKGKNLENEFEKYKYKDTKPIDKYNHLIDAAGYVVHTMLGRPYIGATITLQNNFKYA